MKTLQILENNINERHISEVVNVLRDGGIIIYPTDTLYALGCDALSNSAIERVCALKNKEMARATLSIVCSDIISATCVRMCPARSLSSFPP